jgi:ABC-type glycerol-3-phosphate transport system substrate-binding protein
MAATRTGRQIGRRAFLKAAAGGAGLALGTRVPARAPGQLRKHPVTIWAHFAGRNYEILSRLVGEFNQTTPDVEVKLTSYGPGEITPKYLAAVAAGAPPDVFHAPGYVPPDFAQNKVILPLDDLVKLDPTTFKNFDPITVYGGRRYGVPVNGGLGCMLYNLELLEKAGLDPKKLPETWDELIAAATRMTSAADNQWGLMLGNKAGFTTAQTYWSFLTAAGGEWVTPDGKASAIDSEPGLETLRFFADNVRARKISPVKLYTDVEAWNDWSTRKIGAVLLYPVFTANILATGVRSMTAPPPRKARRGAHFAGNYWCISSGSKNREAVAKFCRWWVQPAVSGRWAAESGATPNSQAAADHPTYRELLQKNPLARAFLDTIPIARPFPGVVGLPAVIQVVSEMVEQAVVGGVAPKEALTRASARIDQELKRAQKA